MPTAAPKRATVTYSNGSSSPPELGKMTAQDCVKRLSELRASTGDTTSEQTSVTARLEALKQAARAKVSPTAPLPVPPPVGSHNPFGFPAWDADLTNRGDDASGNADGVLDASRRGHEPLGDHPTGGGPLPTFTPPTAPPTPLPAPEPVPTRPTTASVKALLETLRDTPPGPARNRLYGQVVTLRSSLAADDLLRPALDYMHTRFDPRNRNPVRNGEKGLGNILEGLETLQDMEKGDAEGTGKK